LKLTHFVNRWTSHLKQHPPTVPHTHTHTMTLPLALNLYDLRLKISKHNSVSRLLSVHNSSICRPLHQIWKAQFTIFKGKRRSNVRKTLLTQSDYSQWNSWYKFTFQLSTGQAACKVSTAFQSFLGKQIRTSHSMRDKAFQANKSAC